MTGSTSTTRTGTSAITDLSTLNSGSARNRPESVRPTTTALAVAAPKLLDDTFRIAEVLVKSGFFKDLRDVSQGVTKILYGTELGFGPMASVLGVYIVEGRPSLSAQLIAAAVQRSGRYTYRVREWTPTACRIEFFDSGESLGESSFTIQEAAAAGLANKAVWKSYPKAMLWARAMSQGARAYCAEVFMGAIYTPEELGAVVDEDGRVVEMIEADAEVVDEPVDPALNEAMELWDDARLEAARLGIEHKDLPDGARLEQVQRWTIALMDRINKAAVPA